MHAWQIGSGRSQISQSFQPLVSQKSMEAGHRGHNFAYTEEDKEKFRNDPTYALQYRMDMENEMVSQCCSRHHTKSLSFPLKRRLFLPTEHFLFHVHAGQRDSAASSRRLRERDAARSG